MGLVQKSMLKNLTANERQVLREFVRRLLRQFNDRIETVILFGSKARGEGIPESDIDVLVVVNSEEWRVRREIRYIAADVWLEYLVGEARLSTRVWSSAHYRRVQNVNTLLYQNISRDGIDLLEVFTPTTP